MSTENLSGVGCLSVRDTEGGLRRGTPMNLVVGRIWKGWVLCKNNGSVSMVKRLDICTRDVEFPIQVSLRRSGVEVGVIVSSRGAGWMH